MRTPGDSAMLCRFAHVQSVTFFAHAVVCTVIQRRGRGSATFGPDRSRHTRATSVKGAGGTAGPGRASSRRAEPQARGANGERAGGRTRRHPEHRRRSHDLGARGRREGQLLTTRPRRQYGGCRRARVHSRVPEGGGRAWPGFEIDYSEPQARVWRSRGRAAALRHQDRLTRTRRHREPGRRAGGRARRHPEHRRRSHDLVDIRLGPGTPPSTGPEGVCDVSRARLA